MRIEQARAEDSERVRALRLGALRDAPDAFAATFAEDEALSPAVWRERLASPSQATFVATVEGADVGLVVGSPYAGRAGCAGLFAMWVAPGRRGTGVADALVRAVVDWARTAGHARVLLDVADDNARAIEFYARMGFVPTGRVGTLPAPREHVREHERVLEL
ncbi:MAG: GNAT family N-acetyltransferase [bacterium]|nr:GNAT family N-acetyltransferase [bacterium]